MTTKRKTPAPDAGEIRWNLTAPAEDKNIPVNALLVSALNPRVGEKTRDAAYLELLASVRELGVLEPLLVRPDGDGYEVLAGSRRLRAAREVADGGSGYEATVPCRVLSCDDRTAAMIAVAENLQRADLSPLEEGEAVAGLLARGWSAAEAAEKLGRSPSWAARRARLAELSASWREAAGDPLTGVSAWSAAALERIAALPAETQERMFGELLGPEGILWPFDRDYTGDTRPAKIPAAEEVRGWTEQEERALDAAPWKRDDAGLLAHAGACSACPKRTGAQPELFDSGPKAGDRCLDGVCYEAKTRAYVERQREALARRAKLAPEAVPVLAVRPESYPGALHRWQQSTVTKSTPGAVAAVIGDGADAGKTVYIEPPRTGKAGGKSAPIGSVPEGLGRRLEKTLAEKRADLEVRRAKRVKALIRDALDADPEDERARRLMEPPETEFAAHDWLIVGLALGVDLSRCDEIAPDVPRDLGLAARIEAYLDLAEKNPAISVIWPAIRQELWDRLDPRGMGTRGQRQFEADDLPTLCDWLGLDHAGLTEQAAREHPEPRAWAREELAEKAAKPGKRPAAPKAPGAEDAA